MATYTVYLPITGLLVVGGVEADSEKEAIGKAMEVDCHLIAQGDDGLDHEQAELESWEAHEHIVLGNVFYGQQNSAEAVLEEE